MREYTTIFNLHDTYYSLLERYMKHVFVAGPVTGDFFLNINFFETLKNRKDAKKLWEILIKLTNYKKRYIAMRR